MKIKHNRKINKFIVGIGVILLAFALPMFTMAEGNSRRANIKSTGTISFENGKIYLASSDLTYLADEMDHLEKTCKAVTVDALNAIGTYFKKDGTILHDKSKNELNTAEEKTVLEFGNLMEGIRQSQSVAELASIQATDKNGNLLYFIDETAQAGKNLQAVSTENSEYPVFYQAATAETLSAGTAAWVEGKLIRGNGQENAAYYSKGWIDGQASITDNLDISYTRHYHEGDAINGGGCYEKVSSTKVCGAIEYKRTYWRANTCHALCYSQYEDEYACKTCGKVTGSSCGGGGNSCGRISGTIGGMHYITEQLWKPVCGYEDGQILSATIRY